MLIVFKEAEHQQLLREDVTPEVATRMLQSTLGGPRLATHTFSIRQRGGELIDTLIRIMQRYGFVRKLLTLAHTALKTSSCASPIKILIYTCKLVREPGPFFTDFCLVWPSLSDFSYDPQIPSHPLQSAFSSVYWNDPLLW